VKPPQFRIAGTAEVIMAVPHLLGFHPKESLVVVGLRETYVRLTGRLDLAEVKEAIPDLLQAIRHNNIDAVYLIVFTELGLTHDEELVVAMTACEPNGLEIEDTVIVSQGRWLSTRCTDPQCCPADGRPLQEQTSMINAELTLEGSAPLQDRAALAALLDPYTDERLVTVDLMDYVFGQFGDEADFTAAKRAMFTSAGEPAAELTATQVARYGMALMDLETRNALWIAVDDGQLPDPALWQELAKRLPASYRAAPLLLFGWASYLDGRGGLARIAAEKAVECDPQYTAADLLMAYLKQGVNPKTMPRLNAKD
jgi:hypothetical protein